MAVGPALADDDGDVDVDGDGVSVGGDDGATVSAGDDGDTNGSTTVSGSADSDGDADGGVSVSGGDGDGTDGAVDCEVSTETDDPTDACETSGGDSGGDSPEAPNTDDAPDAGDTGDAPSAERPEADTVGFDDEVSTPDEPVEAPDLPVSYGEDVPFDDLPPLCKKYVNPDDAPQPVDPTDPFGDAPVNKSQLPKELQEPPQTPVGNPVGLVGVPVRKCNLFNPYSPPVNPTDPPDDPSGSVEIFDRSAGQDGVSWLAGGEVSTADEERGPGGKALTAAWANRERSGVVLDADGTGSASGFGASADVRSPNQPNRTDAMFTAAAFGKGVSLSLSCDGSECKPKAGGVPSGGAIPAFPAGGGSDDGDSGEDGSEDRAPCTPPVTPKDAVGMAPVDPQDPPGPDKIGGQPFPPQTPIGNPAGLVGLPLSYCDVVNPNNPPVDPENPPQNPDGDAETYQREAGEDGVTYFGGSEARTGDGDGTQQGEALYRVTADRNRTMGILIIEGNDGAKDYYSESRVDYQPGTKKGNAFTAATVFGKSASVSVTCDGSQCKPKAGGVPSGNAIPAIPTGGSNDDGGDDGQPEPDPSGDTGEPELLKAGEDGVVIVDDRGASLGDGLPSGDNEVIVVSDGNDTRVEQEGQGSSGQGNSAGTSGDARYERGENLGDDDAQADVETSNGARVKLNVECQDYDCSYRGSGFSLPSTPGPAPAPGSLVEMLMGMA